MADPGQSENNQPADDLLSHDKQTLLQVANDAISNGAQTGRETAVNLGAYCPALRAPGASFVTLKMHNQLRGCIGSLEARRPLIEDVAANAFAAAFRDPRFKPVAFHELLNLDISISILTAPVEMSFNNEAELLKQLQPGIDGLIIEDQGRRGTFLPAVWEQLPKPQMFVANLKRKAGLPVKYWSNTLRVWRYESRSIK